MRIGLLIGSLKNAGDFLISKRSKELLQYGYPDAFITEIPRWISLEQQLDEVNKNDVLVFAGGPGYIPNLYPGKVPLVSDLNELRPKIFMLGMGWWGGDIRNDVLYNIKFQDKMIELLKRAENDTGILGCRDWYSVRLLKNNGFNKTAMTGCPAWYNLEYVNHNTIQVKKDFKNIYISDPAYMYNHDKAIELVRFITARYKDANVKFVFHRGYEHDKVGAQCWGVKPTELYDRLLDMGITCINIENTAEGLKVYDDCDLHIGFRVHGHLYNLSRHNCSILIEEDGRGVGANQALGLPLLSPYDLNQKLPNDVILSTKMNNCKHNLENKYFIKNIEDYLFCYKQNNYMLLKNAINIINSNFENMINHIKSIENYL